MFFDKPRVSRISKNGRRKEPGKVIRSPWGTINCKKIKTKNELLQAKEPLQ
jgi:hypothetical protein